MGIDWGKDIVNIDLECTASEKEKGSICEIGAVLINKNTLEIRSEFSSLVQPYKEYFDDEAMAVHGIPKEELYKSRSLEIVLDNFQLWITKFVKDDERHVILSAYGAYFDIPYLEESYKFLNREYPFDRKTIDIKSIVRDYFAMTGKPFKGGLRKASERLEIPFDGQAHRALDDARQGALIFKEIGKRKLKMHEYILVFKKW